MNPQNLSAQQDVLDTLELVELLSLHLTLVDLATCVQVNRHWNNVFAPLLWHTIDDKKLLKLDQNAPRAERNEIMDEIRTRFKKYGHHIRVLHAQWDIVIEAASFSCTRLRSLHLEPNDYCKIDEQDTWAAYPGATEAAEAAKAVIALNKAREEARRAAGIEAYYASIIAAAATSEEAERLSTLLSTDEGRTQSLAVEGRGWQLACFLNTFTVDEQENKAAPVVREIKQLPGDLGVLYIDRTKMRLELNWITLQDCWRLIAANPGLQKLRLEQMPVFQEREASRRFVHAVLAGLKDLKELILPPSLMDHVDFWSLDEFAPKIESLGVRNDCWSMSDNGPQQHSTLSLPQKTIRGLKSFSLQAYGMTEAWLDQLKKIKLTSIQLLLERLPDLETLLVLCKTVDDLENTTGTSLGLVPSTLQHHKTFALKKLQFRHCPAPRPPQPWELNGWKKTSGQPASLLPHFPNLTELEISGISEETVDALVAHCKKLEIISPVMNPWFIDDLFQGRSPPAGINNLLVHLPALRILDMIEKYILVDELVQVPWVCLGLEKFRCRIVGLERLSRPQEEVYNRISAPGYSVDLTAEELAILEQFHRCRKQQGQVYDQLACLTKLKVLDLGYEWRYPWTYKGDSWYEVGGVEYLRYEDPIPDTLELSLDSGLDRLSALKDLEMFGFEGSDHRIGEKELDWMAEKWPKLKLMYGLAEDKLMSIEYDHKKAELREYLHRLKPEVVHDCLFEDRI